jgi:histidine triad (HIT) family protein
MFYIRDNQNECPFCKIEKIKDRIFYENKGWIAFLAAPPYTKGHTIFAVKKKIDKCPQDLLKDIDSEHLKSLGDSLKEIFRILKKVYKVDNITISSLRGNIQHFHFHLIPIHGIEEMKWRVEKGHKKGHLFEYLGYLEIKGFEKSEKQRIEKGWTKHYQRDVTTDTLRGEILSLRIEADQNKM